MSCVSSQSAEDLPEKASMEIPEKAKEDELPEKRKEELAENPKEMQEKQKEAMKNEPPEEDGKDVVCAKIRYRWEDDNLVVTHTCLICCYVSYEYDNFINHMETEHILLLQAMSMEESTVANCDNTVTETIVLEETIDTTTCATSPACQNMDNEKVLEREIHGDSESPAIALLFKSKK